MVCLFTFCNSTSGRCYFLLTKYYITSEIKVNMSTNINRRIKAALIDLSGTLHIENLAIPGSVEALRRLRDAGIAVRFVTNTTKESKRVLVQRLTNCGFQISPSEIFTSLTAARDLVESRGLRPLLLLEDAALEDFEGISSEQDHNAVVIGLAPSRFDYANLNKAFRLVMDGADLIAIHKSRYFAQNDGLSLGPGPFATALEFATGKTATVVGKPEKNFFLSALRDLNCSPSEAVMIGDDAKDDVEGALRAGLQAVLVQTGKYRENDEEKLSLKPTIVSKSFPEAVDWILNSE